VFVGAAIAGNISGGAFNPAVGTGMLMNSYHFDIQCLRCSRARPEDCVLFLPECD
jgi:hypothetical protein